jgi:hypothetical protein
MRSAMEAENRCILLDFLLLARLRYGLDWGLS